MGSVPWTAAANSARSGGGDAVAGRSDVGVDLGDQGRHGRETALGAQAADQFQPQAGAVQILAMVDHVNLDGAWRIGAEGRHDADVERPGARQPPPGRWTRTA